MEDVGARLDDTTRDWERRDERGTVRVAVVGLGGYAMNRGLPGLVAADHCAPTVAVSGTPETAAAARERFGLDRTLDYAAYNRGEAADAYDAVYVTTPPGHHPEVVETAARLGKHVLCEKPMAATVEGATRMRDACEDAGVVLMVAYRMQFDPVVRRIRALLDEGVVGDVVQCHGSISFRLRTAWGGSLDTWRTDRELAGGGALPDLGVYPLNTARFFLRADPVSVWGSTTTTDLAFRDVDQHVTVGLAFPEGTTGSFTASHDAHPESHFQVLGTEGRVFVERVFVPGGRRTVRVERGDERTRLDGPGVNEIEETFAAFGYAVLTGDRPGADGDHGLVDMRTMAAVYESADRGVRVDLDAATHDR